MEDRITVIHCGRSVSAIRDRRAADTLIAALESDVYSGEVTWVRIPPKCWPDLRQELCLSPDVGLISESL